MDIKEIGFGDFCTIEQKRYVGPNEFYGYKVVGRKKSNVWTDVPVDANNEKETLHDHLDDVVTVVCNNLDDRTVHQFRVRDLASVKKARAVPEGFVLVPVDQLNQWGHMANYAEQYGCPECFEARGYAHTLTCEINEYFAIEAQEPAPLKLGDLVKPIDHRYTLASGCERYPYAYVVNTNPFQLMSEEGDMYWCCTVEASGYKLIKSNDQLPEAVSLRMIREGLLSPVETQEPTHD